MQVAHAGCRSYADRKCRCGERWVEAHEAHWCRSTAVMGMTDARTAVMGMTDARTAVMGMTDAGTARQEEWCAGGDLPRWVGIH